MEKRNNHTTFFQNDKNYNSDSSDDNDTRPDYMRNLDEALSTNPSFLQMIKIYSVFCIDLINFFIAYIRCLIDIFMHI